MNRKLAFVFGLSLSLLSATGCGLISSESSSGDTKNALTVQVNAAPPAEKEEASKPSAPGYGFIWVSGYWDYLDGNYVWRDGRWVQGKSDYEYVRASYANEGGSWVFHRPHWKRRATASR